MFTECLWRSESGCQDSVVVGGFRSGDSNSESPPLHQYKFLQTMYKDITGKKNA